MTSFEDLESIVKKLIKLGLQEGIGKMYFKSISNAHSSLKTAIAIILDRNVMFPAFVPN